VRRLESIVVQREYECQGTTINTLHLVSSPSAWDFSESSKIALKLSIVCGKERGTCLFIG
jgi:hypothetical protein